MHRIEYRVRPVTRYIVTRFEQEYSGDACSNDSASCCGKGEYDNANTAYEVAYALCKAEHESLGWPMCDERIQYPRHPHDEGASPVE